MPNFLPLSEKGGRAGALWIFIIASAIGGIFSVFVMMVATPMIANFALQFGPPEYFALTLLGLSVVSGISGGSVLRGILSCLFGLFLATVGTDGITGVERFTFDSTILLGGIELVPAMVGLLAISEIFLEAEQPFTEYKGSAHYRGLREEMPTLPSTWSTGSSWLNPASSEPSPGLSPEEAPRLPHFLPTARPPGIPKNPNDLGTERLTG